VGHLVGVGRLLVDYVSRLVYLDAYLDSAWDIHKVGSERLIMMLMTTIYNCHC
jgi:hypothetical protein